MGKLYMILSGKGGVGKSTITASLAIALTHAKLKVCIVDGDIGLRDQDAILGLENRVIYDLVDVCSKDCQLSQACIMHPDYPGLSLLPAAQFATIKDLDKKVFRKVLVTLKEHYDIVLIDCPAGIDRGLKGIMTTEADETILIVTPDDVCIRNAERVMMVLDKKQLPRPSVIVNRLNPSLIAAGEMYSAQTVADTLDIPLLGEVPEDPVVYRALLKKTSVMNCECEASAAFHRIALRLNQTQTPLPGYGTNMSFFQRLLHKPKGVKLI